MSNLSRNVSAAEILTLPTKIVENTLFWLMCFNWQLHRSGSYQKM